METIKQETARMFSVAPARDQSLAINVTAVITALAQCPPRTLIFSKAR